MIVIFLVISSITIQTVYGGECGYYASYPLDVCLEGKQYSNYFYCNDTNYLYKKQYGNSDCAGTASSTQPLCDPKQADCIGSCGDTCPYVSQKSYSSSTTTCNKATDDWQEVAYIMDYCHTSSTTSFKFACTAIGQLTFTSYSDDMCNTMDPDQTYPITVDNLPLIDGCLETTFVSNDCNETITSDHGQDNIGCPVHAFRPLDVCYGNHGDTSYSNYFYCDNKFLYWKQYANDACSGSAVYDNKLCNSRFDACPVSECGSGIGIGSTCDYFVQRKYSGTGNCDQQNDDWNEVTYPIGYCVDLTSSSLQAECNSVGGLTYTQYTDRQCQVVNGNPVDIVLTGDVTVIDNGCLVISIYVTCAVPSNSPSEQPSKQPSKQPSQADDVAILPSAAPIVSDVNTGGASGYCYSILLVMYSVAIIVAV